MSEVQLVAPRVPFLDERTGMVSREWYLFFNNSFTRMGGNVALTNVQLESSITEVTNNVFEGNNFVPSIPDQIIPGDVSPPIQFYQDDYLLMQVNYLMEKVADLENQLNSLKQGAIVL